MQQSEHCEQDEHNQVARSPHSRHLASTRDRTALAALELVRRREDFARELREAAQPSQRASERARVADVHAA